MRYTTRRRRVGPQFFIAVLALALMMAVVTTVRWPALAQEGHPVAGTWHGTWGPNASDRHDVTLVLDYDGKAITGMMNPGPEAIHFDTVTLEPSSWNVRFEATPKIAGKAAAPIMIDARIEDVTSRHRSMVGTWTQGAVKGDFKVSRDD